MKPRFLLVVGLAAGYVIGARAGREKYEQLKTTADDLWQSPRVKRARREVEEYARTQAPIIRERAEAVAKAAPGVVSDAARNVASTAKDVAGKTVETAKDVAEKTAETAKDVAGKTAETAKTVAGKTAGTARDVAGKTAGTAKDVAGKTAATAKDVAGKVQATAVDARDKAAGAADSLRKNGEDLAGRAIVSAGAVRDDLLDDAPGDTDPDDNITVDDTTDLDGNTSR